MFIEKVRERGLSQFNTKSHKIQSRVILRMLATGKPSTVSASSLHFGVLKIRKAMMRGKHPYQTCEYAIQISLIQQD